MSHTATEQWQSFEMRMRHRRAERCRIRAEVAIQEGCYEEAVAALAEACKLEPDAPENAAVDRLISDRSAGSQPEIPARGHVVRWVAAAAILLVVSAAGVQVFLMHRSLDAGVPQAPAISDAMPQPRAAAPDVHPISTLTVAPTMGSVQPESEDVTPAPEKAPPPASREGTATTGSYPFPQAVAVPEHETPLPQPVATAAPPPAASFPLAEPAVADPPTRIPGNEVPVSRPGVADQSNQPRTVDERNSIRSVLSKYEAAYSTLDAAAAGEVWPDVDQRALARAFQSLESQRVSLGDCNVIVTGATAHAECSGSAMWTPKVGGGSRTQPRSWAFDLTRDNDGWLIRSARTK